MVPESSQPKDSVMKKPVFLVSHSKQEEVCKEIYDDLICKKLKKLKDAVLHFNKVIKQILK